MKKPKQRLLQSIDRELDALTEMRNIINEIPVNLISQMFPQGSWQKNYRDVTFSLPLSFRLIEEFKAAMSEQFPEFKMTKENQYVWDNVAQAARFLGYTKPITKEDGSRISIVLEVAFRSSITGSTCVLNPIGKKTVIREEINYEIVCSEAAANEFSIKE